MKTTLKKLAIALIAVAIGAVAYAADRKPMRYVPATDLRIINKGWDTTYRTFTRIPAILKDSVRPELWERMQNSAGIGVRFATNSSRVGVKYQLQNNFHMLHMADTGIKGTDLYVYDADAKRWRYVNTNRPAVDSLKVATKVYVENVDTTVMREYMIYLPLYDGVRWLEVGIDDDAAITAGDYTLPRSDKKIVGYGTSILHGGCASRTGMAATNIMSRELDCEFVNLGVSGEGKMDFPMARQMATIDADVYLLDPIPNCTEMMCDTITYDFVKILREAKPGVPIVMLEGPMYPYGFLDSGTANYLPRKNANFRKNYERLVADGYKDLYYVTMEEALTEAYDEGTVDGIHLTDYGFRLYADKLIPVLKPLLDPEKK